MNQITKNQHYVPRFLLEGFRTNDEQEKLSKVNVFDIRSNRERMNQSIIEEFSQNYFYDKDNAIENFLEHHIETPSSIIVNQFRKHNFDKLNVDCQCLIKLMCSQIFRTQETLNQVLEHKNEEAYHLANELCELNEFDFEGDIRDLFSLSYTGRDAKRDVITELVLDSILVSKGMEDLKLHVLINKSEQGFIISDHPVIKYNWLYRDLKSPKASSLMAKGVQLFLPISKEMYLCAYDSSVYKYGNRSDDVTVLSDKCDVDFLNILQVKNSINIIGFSKNNSINGVKDLISKHYGKKTHITKSSPLGKPTYNEDGNISSYGMTYIQQIKLQSRPTFFKLLKKSAKVKTKYVVRNPDIADATAMLFEHRDKKIKQAKALTS